MGDIFSGWTQTILGPKVQRKQRSLERSRANFGIQQASNALQTHIEETQRSGALLGQTLAARGLRKSSIAEQETARFQRLSERRRGELEKGLHIAIKYKKYLKSRHKLQRATYYAGMMDLALDTALTAIGLAGGMPSGGAEVDAITRASVGG